MKEVTFKSANEAMLYLANLTGKKVIVAASNKVENPRLKPENDIQKENWKKSAMWGDYKNHKYPLFDKKSGSLSEKMAMVALRYINQAKGKKSYPTVEDASKVLAKIVKTALKLNPSAKIKYQPKDKVYKVLPESIKKKMNGYEDKSKKASISLLEIDEFLKIATEELIVSSKEDIIDDLKRIKTKGSNKKLTEPVKKAIQKAKKSMNNITCEETIDAIADYLAGKDKEDISKEDVETAESIDI